MGNEFTMAKHEVVDIHDQKMGRDFIDWGLHSIMIHEAWQVTKGEGIKVAVLDTGADLDHPDLKGNIVGYRDFTNSQHGANDVEGHGTHVAGIISGIDNGIGMVGVAPHAQLLIGKVLGDNGAGSFNSIVEGIEWALDQGADVINMSLGASVRPPNAFHEVIKKAYNKGVIMIAATGNENGEVSWPAQYDEVLAVSAMDKDYERAGFSNYGLTNEIMAPGVDILSTYRDGTYAELSGTSMATPIISGAVALYLSNIRKATVTKVDVEVVHNALLQATVDLGKDGKDEYYGAGLINLAKLF